MRISRGGTEQSRGNFSFSVFSVPFVLNLFYLSFVASA
jgi:hypothetical protein